MKKEKRKKKFSNTKKNLSIDTITYIIIYYIYIIYMYYYIFIIYS